MLNNILRAIRAAVVIYITGRWIIIGNIQTLTRHCQTLEHIRWRNQRHVPFAKLLLECSSIVKPGLLTQTEKQEVIC